MVANWFFSGHRNKLTFDFSRLRTMANQSGRRWANLMHTSSYGPSFG
jgi:hypothetical protein